jgi:hypothetical protein
MVFGPSGDYVGVPPHAPRKYGTVHQLRRSETGEPVSPAERKGAPDATEAARCDPRETICPLPPISLCRSQVEPKGPLTMTSP